MRQPKIKKIEFINGNDVMINGNLYVLRQSFVTELEHVLNQIHFHINGFNIFMRGRVCFRCGEIFDKQISSHHTLPNVLKPKYNVHIPMCEDCHLDLNALYKEAKSEKI